MASSLRKVTLKNRFRDIFVFEPIANDTYLFKGVDYMTVTSNDDGSILAIDPPGGPYLYVGSKLGDHKISEIIFDKTKSAWLLKVI